MKTNSKILSAFAFIGLILIFYSSCEKDEDEDSKQISVTTTIAPSTIASGGSAQYTISIKNLGQAIIVTRVHLKDEYISGWAVGQPAVEIDLPTTNISFAAKETKTVFNYSLGPLTNTGTSDVGVKNTVTAYYEGGSASDVITYTITRALKKSDSNIILKTLVDDLIVESPE